MFGRASNKVEASHVNTDYDSDKSDDKNKCNLP